MSVIKSTRQVIFQLNKNKCTSGPHHDHHDQPVHELGAILLSQLRNDMFSGSTNQHL